MDNGQLGVSPEPNHIVFYWSGNVPQICELSILSALNRTDKTQVHIFLDCDRDFESLFPTEFSSLAQHPRFFLHGFKLSTWAKRRNLRALPFWDFSNFSKSDACSTGSLGSIGHRTLSLTNLLSRKYGYLRAKFGEQALAWIQKYVRLSPQQHRFFRFFAGYPHEFFEDWGPSSLRFALLTKGKAYRSDVFRTLVSNLYPGESVLYADLDVYFAKDLCDWDLRTAFVYRWEDYTWGNSALLFFPRDRNALRKSLNRELFRGFPALPWFLYSEENCLRLGIRILPVDKFDPMWSPGTAHFGDSDAFFEKHPNRDVFLSQIREQFNAVHWHNHWSAVPHNESAYAVLLERERNLNDDR